MTRSLLAALQRLLTQTQEAAAVAAAAAQGPI
jgi:hypothetical protein